MNKDEKIQKKVIQVINGHIARTKTVYKACKRDYDTAFNYWAEQEKKGLKVKKRIRESIHCLSIHNFRLAESIETLELIKEKIKKM